MSRTRGNKACDSIPVSSTRDVVESSIELSKEDACTTWEESAVKRLGKVSRWEDGKKRPSPEPSDNASL